MNTITMKMINQRMGSLLGSIVPVGARPGLAVRAWVRISCPSNPLKRTLVDVQGLLKVGEKAVPVCSRGTVQDKTTLMPRMTSSAVL